MKKTPIFLAVLAIAVNLVGCALSDTAAPVEIAEQVIAESTAETVTTPFGYEDAIVVDDETMDFWRSLLCIKGDPITFPCTYNDLKNILDKHGITIKPTECWSDDNPDDRDVCFVDLYDKDICIMTLTGTCVAENDLENYIFDGTGVGKVAQNYISINEHDPKYIGDICEETILSIPLKNVGLDGDRVAVIQVKNKVYFCEARYYVNGKTNTLESFSIAVHDLGGSNNE